MDNEQFESRRERMPADTRKKGGNKMLVPIIIILLLVVGGVVGFVFMSKKDTTKETLSKDTVSAEPTSEPLPTEEEVDLKSAKIMVINGTEVAGEAGKLKTALTEAGFDVTAIGNADKTTYTKSIIQAKSKVSAGFIAKLKEEVSKTYEVGTDETLEDSDDNDVKVIIGIPADKQKTASDSADTKETPKPTETKETETPTPTTKP